jgi:hypothetical protein
MRMESMNPGDAPEQESAPEVSDQEKLAELVALFQKKREQEFGGDPLNDENVLRAELERRKSEEAEFHRRSPGTDIRRENAA